jgi:hypothetical protein
VITARVEGLDRFDQAFSKFFASVERKVEKRFHQTASTALQWMAQESPQYSGDFAANWKVAINGIDVSFDYQAVSGQADFFRDGGKNEGARPFQQGDPEAIRYALVRGEPILARAKFGDYVTISNSAARGEFSYAWLIEEGKIRFRPVNVSGGRVISRLLETFRSLPV